MIIIFYERMGLAIAFISPLEEHLKERTSHSDIRDYSKIKGLKVEQF